MKIRLFGKLDITISESDWTYLCNHRFFTDNPSIDEIEAEFISGTGITSKKIDKWEKASEKFSEYINDLREIETLNINGMARDLLSNEEKCYEA